MLAGAQAAETALHIAAQLGDQALVDLLLRHGADPAVPRTEGDDAATTEALCAAHGVSLTRPAGGA